MRKRFGVLRSGQSDYVTIPTFRLLNHIMSLRISVSSASLASFSKRPTLTYASEGTKNFNFSLTVISRDGI